jgi:hypothetical protein
MSPKLCVASWRGRIAAAAGRVGPALALSLALSLALLLATPALARPALGRGEALRFGPPATADLQYAQNQRLVPLEEVIQSLRRRYSGDKLDARILERPGGVLYEIKWLTADGRKLVITVDAATGAVLGTEGAQ